VKLLISTYACLPNRGSEHSVGWHWTTGARQRGYDVWALVSPAHRDAIEATARNDPTAQEIHWHFPEVKFWPLEQGTEPKKERSYNLLWQMAALRMARKLHSEVGFDAIHHLTWGGIRYPTFLGRLGVPLILGPTGGGEVSPSKLRRDLHIKGKIAEALRDISNHTLRFNPLVRGGLDSAAVIFVKTPQTRLLLKGNLREKATTFLELGVNSGQIGSPRPARSHPHRLLYAGRLLYWKGLHIAIEALRSLVDKMPEARLTIVGSGPEENWLKALASERNLKDAIDFVPWLPQNSLFELYLSHDLLLFPSLHDSSGGVVLEALCHGMPVVCLDLGGPKEIVTKSCGVIVGTTGLDSNQLSLRLADELYELLKSPERVSGLSAGAIARAQEFVFENRIAAFYEKAMQYVARQTGGREDWATRNL
jgi:glycosyltransferase involved in cell wall biosynthesis